MCNTKECNNSALLEVPESDTITRRLEVKSDNPEEYNGWSNHATWRVNLEIVDGIDWQTDVEDGITYDDLKTLSEDIKERVVEYVEGFGGDNSYNDYPLMHDYAMSFLEDISWYDIAVSVSENYPKLIKG